MPRKKSVPVKIEKKRPTEVITGPKEQIKEILAKAEYYGGLWEKIAILDTKGISKEGKKKYTLDYIRAKNPIHRSNYISYFPQYATETARAKNIGKLKKEIAKTSKAANKEYKKQNLKK